MTSTSRPPLSPRTPVSSVEELLRSATERTPLKTADSLSSATFERVVIDGERFVLKHLHCDDDWIMRATGDLMCRPALLWTSGLLDQLPPQIDHAIADVATGLGRNGWGAAILMHDVAEHLVPEGDSVISPVQHDRFLRHMALLHAHFWGFEDTLDLASPFARYFFLNPLLPVSERELGRNDGVPALLEGGWDALRSSSPQLGALLDDLFVDAGPFLEAIERTPATLVHSDWKYGNLGSRPVDPSGEQPTILIDWAFPGRGPACADLAWYLAVNCRRLPGTKDAAIATYRSALVQAGVDVEPWWDEQLALAFLGAFIQLGWSKALDGRDDEFVWWEERATDAMRWLA